MLGNSNIFFVAILHLVLLVGTKVEPLNALQLPKPPGGGPESSSHAITNRRAFWTKSLPIISSAFLLVTSNPGSANSQETGSQQQEFATSAGRKGCSTQSDPGKTIVTCTGDLWRPSSNKADSSSSSTTTIPRLSSIAATENGISTSAVKNPSRFSPPWTYLTETSDPSKAYQSLKASLKQLDPQLEIVNEQSSSSTAGDDATYYYIHAVVPSPPSVDDLEFVVRASDNVVLYRSASRTSVFVYPLTQPVSDGNRNLKRLQRLRQILGWEELGYAQMGSKPL